MDASVYLHLELSEEVLLLFKQPEEFAEPSKENLDCHEKCSIIILVNTIPQMLEPYIRMLDSQLKDYRF